jgi:hypothetical protein
MAYAARAPREGAEINNLIQSGAVKISHIHPNPLCGISKEFHQITPISAASTINQSLERKYSQGFSALCRANQNQLAGRN